MNQKTVLITGASKGLGAAIAETFANHNYNIVLNYNTSQNEACKLKEELERKTNVLLIKADVSNEEEVKKMIEQSIIKYQKIDVLVNNAGIAIDTIFEEKDKENFEKILKTNLIGPFLVAKYVSKHMLEEKNGAIINITSTNGIDTYYPESMDYDASKAGLISLTHNLALALAPYIRVNAIAAGWMETDMNKEMDLAYKEQEEQKILLKRFAKPEEIARVVYFLTTKDASYINNEIIRVDGGYHV